MIVPKRRLKAPAQEGLRWPTRIGRDERAIALDRRTVVVAAQDDPFREFPRDRIGNDCLDLRGIRWLVLAHEVDDVFQRLGIGLRGRSGRGHRRRCDRFTRRCRRQGCVLTRRGRQGRCYRGRGRGRGGVFRGCTCSRRGIFGGMGHDVARDRPWLGHWNFWLGPGLCRCPSKGQRQAGGEGRRSQRGCAGGWGHDVPSRRINQSLKS